MASDKKFYEQLNTFTIADNPASTVQLLSNPVHYQASNKEVLDAIIQVNRAGMRDGSPMPGTGTVKQSPTVTDDTRTVAFAPEKGEVWQVQSITRSAGNITGAAPVTLYVYDSVTENILQFFYGSSTSGDFMLKDDGTWGGPVSIDEHVRLEFKVHSSTNWDDAILYMQMTRLR